MKPHLLNESVRTNIVTVLEHAQDAPTSEMPTTGTKPQSPDIVWRSSKSAARLLLNTP